MSRSNLLGRLLAVLEHYGYAEPQLYQLACSQPARLIDPLRRVTAGRGDEVAELLLPIVAQLSSDAFESSLSDVAQSEFMLGYYHQRAELYNRAAATGLPQPAAEVERWDIQIEPELKQWAIENGGSTLVGVLLRQAREQQQG